jgi:hypothetical protein
VPIGKCIDWLEKRTDVDASPHRRQRLEPGRLLRRARGFDGAAPGRLHLARRDLGHPRALEDRDDNHGLAGHIKWVFGAKTMAEATEIAKPTSSSRACWTR